MTTVHRTSGSSAVNYIGANETSASGPAAMPLLDEPSASGDIGLMIATLVIDNAFTSRIRARQDRQDATNAMIAAQKDQIAHMRDAAEERYAAGQLEAGGKIWAGMFGIAGGAATAGNEEGVGKIYSSIGEIGAGAASLDAKSSARAGELLDADAKAAENEASQQKRIIEAADDDIKEARDYTRAAIDFLREFQSTKTKSLSSAIKG